MSPNDFAIVAIPASETTTPNTVTTQPNHGAPNTAASGFEMIGPMTMVPTSTATALMPRIFAPGVPLPASPAASVTAPSAYSATAPNSRLLAVPVRSKATSRSAASGFTRLALMAGSSELTIVVTSPTRTPTMTVRGASTSEPDGSVAPIALRSAFRPTASPTPPATPPTDDRRPTMNDSMTVEVSICRWLAPTARSIAISRVRCVNTILNEL